MPMGIQPPEYTGAYEVPEHQADATLNQAAPAQNTWYTILNTTARVRIIQLAFAVLVANETLELRITIDGNVLVGTIAATFGTEYTVVPSFYSAAADALEVQAINAAYYRNFILEGRSVKIEIRKTTAVGAGNLRGKAIYAVW